MKHPVIHETMRLLKAGKIVDFNLGDLQIDGRPMFALGKIGRSHMPQLRGFPIKNSVAELLPQDDKGKVDIQQQFLAWLKRTKKIQTARGTMSSNQIKGAQSELVASKVADKLPKLLANKDHKKFKQLYIVSADGTLLDGHHGWATIRLVELLTDTNHHLQTITVMMHIDELIEAAREFTEIVGVSPKEGL